MAACKQYTLRDAMRVATIWSNTTIEVSPRAPSLLQIRLRVRDAAAGFGDALIAFTTRAAVQSPGGMCAAPEGKREKCQEVLV